MTLYELTKTYGDGKGESMMWATVKHISDAVEESMDAKSRHDLKKGIYAMMVGGHYDRDYAIQDTAKMYYKDKSGNRHAAPYWTEQQVREIYEQISGEIPEYNFWDFFVALNMIKSDYCPLLDKWFPGIAPEEKDERFVELTLNWLKDEDNPYGSSKIWSYLNPPEKVEK